MFDDCKSLHNSPVTTRSTTVRADIEHAGHPSVSGPGAGIISPGSGGPVALSFQAGGLDPVEFEGFEQDAGDDGLDDQQYGEEEEAVEMEAVSIDTTARGVLLMMTSSRQTSTQSTPIRRKRQSSISPVCSIHRRARSSTCKSTTTSSSWAFIRSA